MQGHFFNANALLVKKKKKKKKRCEFFVEPRFGSSGLGPMKAKIK
jgi:hypothetical protein